MHSMSIKNIKLNFASDTDYKVFRPYIYYAYVILISIITDYLNVEVLIIIWY